jgi:uncharacterized protein (TIGR00297 family)
MGKRCFNASLIDSCCHPVPHLAVEVFTLSFNWTQIGLGILAAGLIGFLAFRFKLLSWSGSLAAFVLGSVIFGLGGLNWAIILMLFFVTSSGLSGLFQQRKSSAEEKYAKGATRDAGQVLANGGLAGLFVLLHVFIPLSVYPWIGFCVSLAAANADTWATELGALSKRSPRLITTFKSVDAGTSGAVSWLGLAATSMAALVIAVAGTILGFKEFGISAWMMILAITIGGIGGSLVDSLLGATIQAIYYCPQCQKETEKTPFHGCGTPTVLVKGFPWVNNDIVNVFCTVAGAGVALAFISVVTQLIK